MDIIAIRLKECRLQRKLSQWQVAQAIGTTTQQYQLYESGQRLPAIKYLIALCKFFGVESDYILGIKDY